MNNPFKGKHGPLLIAEIGGNHEGDFDYAKELCQLAIDSDVDYVKFQIYSGDKLVSSVENPTRNKHFKKFELSQDQHIELAEMVIAAGKKYTSSVWDIDSFEWILPYMELVKVGSGDLTAYPLLKWIAEKNKPIIISTGLATEKEVLESIKFIQSCNAAYQSPEMLGVLQCTSMYPIPFSEANLAVIPVLKNKTGLTVGYSDHTEGHMALAYSVAFGAEILEFHFTDSRTDKVFRDHKVSLTKSEVGDLINEIKTIAQLHGNPNKEPTKSEIESGHITTFRRAVYPSRDITPGEVFSEDNLTILRPNHGVDAREYFEIVGKRTKKSILKYQKISFDIDE